jgi:hypothetical protein
MISAVGKNLNILISCENIPEHNWMSYLCWYSIKKVLSDANIFISCKRNSVFAPFFNWTKKVNVPFKMYSGEIEKLFTQRPLLIVPPHSLAIRDFEEAGIEHNLSKDINYLENTNFFKDAKTNDFCVFCSYFDGWGNFVTSEWINKLNCPLTIFGKFSKNNMTINEKKIEKIWSNSIPLFQGISGA